MKKKDDMLWGIAETLVLVVFSCFIALSIFFVGSCAYKVYIVLDKLENRVTILENET